MSAFFSASKKAEDVKQSGGNHITGSGMYPVTILAAVVNKSVGGSTSVDMYVDHAGQKQIVYGNLRITNNDGSPNKIGAKTFNQLVIIAEVDEVAKPVEHDLPIGKKSAMKSSAVLEDLCDIDCFMRVQMEFGAHKGNIQEKKIIKAFFREDTASAEEIVNETEVGKGFEREQKYVDNITYNDGMTAEKIKEWIAAGRPKGTGGEGSSEETPENAPDFGKKRSFGGKS